MVQHLHAEAGATTGDGLPDAPEADDAQDRLVRVDTEVLGDPPTRPAPGPQVTLGVRGEPSRREDQQERQVRRGLVEDPRRVAHRDAPRRRRGDIDVVVADRDGGDDPQPVPARGEHLVVDAVGEDAQQRVRVSGGVAQLRFREGNVLLVEDDVVAGGDERVGPALGEPSGDDHAAHAQWVV